MKFTERDTYYARKRDGFRVRVADWPDGDVSWMLDPMPVIAPRVVGTCSAATFKRNHVRLDEEAPRRVRPVPYAQRTGK